MVIFHRPDLSFNLQFYKFWVIFRIQGMLLSFREERSNKIIRRTDRCHAFFGFVPDSRRIGRIFEKRQRSHDVRRFLRSNACPFTRRKPSKRSNYTSANSIYCFNLIGNYWDCRFSSFLGSRRFPSRRYSQKRNYSCFSTP